MQQRGQVFQLIVHVKLPQKKWHNFLENLCYWQINKTRELNRWRTSPKMYRYLPRYGKAENENMQKYASNLVNFGAHLSKILNHDIPWRNSPII